MRVITGIAKGRRLRCTRGEGIRPTADQVKESIFSILGPIEGASVLDLYAGAGSLGIEALSRGAALATFVEASRPHSLLLNQNLEACRFTSSARCLVLPCDRALAKLAEAGERFDLAFLDPPYESGELDRSLTALGGGSLLADGARVVAEHPTKTPPGERYGGLRLADRRLYGQTSVSFFEIVED